MASGTWTAVATTGNWNLATTAPWLNGIVADGATFSANFTSNITATTTVTLTEARTIGNVAFSDNGASGSAWTLAGASNLTLDNGGSSPVLTTTTAATISAPITGTAGFTKAGTGTLTIANSNPALNNTLSGLVTASTGRVQFGNWVENTSASTVSPEQLPYTDISIASTAEVTLSVPATTAYTTAVDYSGDGQLAVVGPTTINANGLTFTGSIAALGPAVPEHSKGLYLRSNQLTANNKAIVTVKDLPRCVTYFHGAGGATTTFEQAIYMDTAAIGAVYPTKIFVRAANTTIVVTSPIQRALYASQLTGAIEIQGGIDRIDEAGTSFPANLTFHLGGGNTEDNKVSGPITNTSRVLNIAKIDSGRWILSGANTYTGTTSITAGVLSAQGVAGTRTPLGGTSAGDVTVSSTGTLDISSTGTDAANLMVVNKTGRALTLGGTGSPQLSSTTGFNQYTCAGVTLNTNLPVSVASGAYLRMGNTAAMAQSGGTWGITKTDDGEYNLGTASNTFAGVVTVTGGTLSFEASVPSGAISPLGNATSAIVLSGTTLKYRGAGGHTLGRAVSLSGSPSFDASGTGAVTFSPAITHAVGARTITFKGSSTNDNTFTTALTNNGGDAVSVTKTEAGKWILSGAPSYAGDTTVSGGTLTFNGQTVQQNVVMNGTGVLDDTVLAGVKNITCNGGTPEIKAATAGNTVSGATSITSGSLRVTTEIRDGGKPVKVLGDTDVTVTGTLQTTKGTLQRGQMRYGGDLTFSAGSTLRIG